MIIKPSEKLATHYKQYSELAHSTNEPIYLSKAGEGDTVLLSIEHYERLLKHDNAPPCISPEPQLKKENDTMSEFFYGQILKEMYNTAPRGTQVTHIHLFGIFYAEQLGNNQLDKKEILKTTGFAESYKTELAKGINLAKYVTVTPEKTAFIQKIEEKLK